MSAAKDTRSRRAGLAFIALLAVLFGLNGIGVIRGCRALRPVHSGEPAPDFIAIAVTQDGRPDGEVRFSSTKGSVVILDFWATWCGPCRSTMPVLEELAKRYGDRGLRVLSVNTEGLSMMGTARRLVNRLAPSVELLMESGEASKLYNVTSIPHMLVIDRNGIVRQVHRGLRTVSGLRSDLIEAIEPLL